ncbi:hypothetical protein D3C73_872990 [compost metagenome]
MIAKKNDVGALHGMRDAFPFADVQREAVVVFVDGQATMEAHGVLRQGGVQAAIGSERERRGVWHVRVQDTGFAGYTVNGGVDKHGRGFDCVPAGKLVAVGVDQHDVISLDLVPHQATRIQQEMIRVTR